MSAINELPPSTEAGMAFDYSVWSAGSVVRMVNVPFDNSYRDIIDWISYGNPKNYIESFQHSQTVRLESMTYLAQGRPIRIPTPFSRAVQFNYLMVQNPGRPSNAFTEDYQPTEFFYFITDVQYINPGTTQLVLQLDVWTTYYSRVTFGRGYVERGHLGIAASDAYSGFGKKWLVQPEGFDIGNEHIIARTYRKVLGDIKKKEYDVIITCTTDITAPYGTRNSPSMIMARGSDMEGLPNGVDIWWADSNAFKVGMNYLADYPWIAQGIGSITLIPKNTIGKEYDKTVTLGNATWYHVSNPGVNNRAMFFLTEEDFRAKIMENLPDDFKELKKFTTSPYCVLELTTYTGNPLEVRPESIATGNIGITMWSHLAPPTPQIFFSINYQNHYGGAQVVFSDGKKVEGAGEEFDAITGYQSLPTFAAVNNASLNYLAANAHTIAQQYNGAKWTQRRAQRQATAARDVANAGIAATQAGAENTMWGNSANADSQSRYNGMRATVQSIQGGMTALGGALALNGQAVGAGLGQAATANIEAMISSSQAQSQAHIQNQLASGASQISQRQQRTVRDTNFELAQFSANGDYENAVAAINAQVQDAQVIPPSVIGQTSGSVTPMVAFNMALDCRIRQISQGAMQRIGEYWLRYGYALNCWTNVTQLSLMNYFTYWKMTECYLQSANMPESFKGTVRGIFEKGVTVWRRPEDIATIDPRKNRVSKDVNVKIEN